MQRMGTCNRCGQCCGADGSPEQNSPWPNTWPEALRDWQEEDLPVIFQMVGHPAFGAAVARVFRISGKNYRSIWVPGHGLCEDKPPWGDVATYSEECPFLMDDPGDGTRPCALVGTLYEAIWMVLCQPEPPEEKSAAQVAQWQARHPLCSYTWE